jgi:hypothetical protein
MMSFARIVNHVTTRRISVPAHWLHNLDEPQCSHYVAQEVQREVCCRI